jgi:hypothetical protein
MGRKKVKWQAGDYFLVPLEDESYSQGQILSYEAHAMNSVVCAFSSLRFESVPTQLDAIPEKSLIAVQFTTRDLLDSGRWRIVNNGPVLSWEKYLDIQGLRRKGFIGAVIHGSGIIEKFLNAYHKLVIWNDYYDPEYLDKMLISPDRKPAGVLLK